MGNFLLDTEAPPDEPSLQLFKMLLDNLLDFRLLRLRWPEVRSVLCCCLLETLRILREIWSEMKKPQKEEPPKSAKNDKSNESTDLLSPNNFLDSSKLLSVFRFIFETLDMHRSSFNTNIYYMFECLVKQRTLLVIVDSAEGRDLVADILQVSFDCEFFMEKEPEMVNKFKDLALQLIHAVPEIFKSILQGLVKRPNSSNRKTLSREIIKGMNIMSQRKFGKFIIEAFRGHLSIGLDVERTLEVVAEIFKIKSAFEIVIDVLPWVETMVNRNKADIKPFAIKFFAKISSFKDSPIPSSYPRAFDFFVEAVPQRKYSKIRSYLVKKTIKFLKYSHRSNLNPESTFERLETALLAFLFSFDKEAEVKLMALESIMNLTIDGVDCFSKEFYTSLFKLTSTKDPLLKLNLLRCLSKITSFTCLNLTSQTSSFGASISSPNSKFSWMLSALLHSYSTLKKSETLIMLDSFHHLLSSSGDPCINLLSLYTKLLSTNSHKDFLTPTISKGYTAYISKSFSTLETMAYGLNPSETCATHAGFRKAMGFGKLVRELVVERLSTSDVELAKSIEEGLKAYLDCDGFFGVEAIMSEIEGRRREVDEFEAAVNGHLLDCLLVPPKKKSKTSLLAYFTSAIKIPLSEVFFSFLLFARNFYSEEFGAQLCDCLESCETEELFLYSNAIFDVGCLTENFRLLGLVTNLTNKLIDATEIHSENIYSGLILLLRIMKRGYWDGEGVGKAKADLAILLKTKILGNPDFEPNIRLTKAALLLYSRISKEKSKTFITSLLNPLVEAIEDGKTIDISVKMATIISTSFLHSLLPINERESYETLLLSSLQAILRVDDVSGLEISETMQAKKRMAKACLMSLSSTKDIDTSLDYIFNFLFETSLSKNLSISDKGYLKISTIKSILCCLNRFTPSSRLRIAHRLSLLISDESPLVRRAVLVNIPKSLAIDPSFISLYFFAFNDEDKYNQEMASGQVKKFLGENCESFLPTLVYLMLIHPLYFLTNAHLKNVYRVLTILLSFNVNPKVYYGVVRALRESIPILEGSNVFRLMAENVEEELGRDGESRDRIELPGKLEFLLSPHLPFGSTKGRSVKLPPLFSDFLEFERESLNPSNILQSLDLLLDFIERTGEEKFGGNGRGHRLEDLDYLDIRMWGRRSEELRKREIRPILEKKSKRFFKEKPKSTIDPNSSKEISMSIGNKENQQSQAKSNSNSNSSQMNSTNLKSSSNCHLSNIFKKMKELKNKITQDEISSLIPETSKKRKLK